MGTSARAVSRAEAAALAASERARRSRVHAGVFLVVLLVAAAALAVKRYGLPALPTVPIESVRVGGEMHAVSRQELEAVVSRYTQAGFFGVDVAAVRNAVLALPWVAEVSVRRVWPDSIHLAVIERTVGARWDAGGLVASDGTVFHPARGTYPDLLPVLEGPPGTAAMMLARYRTMRRTLGEMGDGITRVGLTRRGLWWLRFGSGLTVIVGTADGGARLAQFARVFPALLGARVDAVAQVDLRYANGFAVRWKAAGDGPRLGASG